MFAGMLYFIARGWGVRDRRRRTFYVVTISTTAIAFVSYLVMALGLGLTTVTIGGEEVPIYWARYVDWFFTTPLLLVALGLLAGANRKQLATLVGLDMLMIGTGAVATLSGGPGALPTGTRRVLWWSVSTGFLLVLLYFLYGTLTDQANRLSVDTASTFRLLRNTVAMLWLLYPVWWLVGTEGLGLIGLGPETAGFMMLDLTAKVGWGAILLRSHDVLDDAGTSETTAAVAQA
jgi:bacteriorhodopsin